MNQLVNRFLVFLLSITLLLSVTVICPSAEDHVEEVPKNTTTPYANLYTHWDFEGSTKEKQLNDKAPKGTYKDVLTIPESAADGVAIKNGVASIDTNKGAYLWLDNDNFNKFDCRVLTAKTFLLKFQFSGTVTSDTSIMQIPGIFNLFIAANKKIGLTLYKDSIGNNAAGTVDQTMYSDFTVSANQDIYLAFVPQTIVDNTETTEVTTEKKFECRLYLSSNGYNFASSAYTTNTFTLVADTTGNGRGTAASEGGGIYIGNNNKGTNTGVTFAFDDIRVYNASYGIGDLNTIHTSASKTPVIVGCQNTAVDAETKTQSIRFVSVLSTSDYTEIGYSVTVRYNDGKDDVVRELPQIECTTVYESLLESNNGAIGTVTAQDLGGTYLMPITIDGVPTDKGEIKFVLQAYAKDNTQTYESKSVEVVYNNGAYKTHGDYTETTFDSLVNELKPVAAWSFDGETPYQDLQAAIVGTAQNECILVDGYYGNGLRTDASKSSYLALGKGTVGSKLSGASAVTVSMWILPYQNTNSTNCKLFNVMLNSGSVGIQVMYNDYRIRVSARSNANEFATKDFEYNLSDGTVATLSSKGYTNEGRWQHLAVTVDFANDQIEVFINGTSIGTQTVSFSSTSFSYNNASSSSFYDSIGGCNTSSAPYSFNGVIDSVMVFNKALTNDEVAKLCTERSTATSPVSDQKQIAAILEKLGENIVFKKNATELIQNGKFSVLMKDDLTAAAILENGVPMIPTETAKNVFESTNGLTQTTLGGISYISLQELCEANGKTLFIDGDLFMVVNEGSEFDPVINRIYLDRLSSLFDEHLTPTVVCADSRVVVAQQGQTYTYEDLSRTITYYCQTPSVAKLGDSIFVAMDSGGGIAMIFVSTDGGKTFAFRSQIANFHCGTLFTLNGELYLMGCYLGNSVKEVGIMKLTNADGTSWSSITHFKGADEYNAHTTSNSILFANGRLYKAYNGAHTDGLATGCTVYMVSAPVDADLLDASSWTVSNSLPFTAEMFTGHQNGSTVALTPYIEEGNAVADKDGNVYAMYNIKAAPSYGHAAIFTCTKDGATVAIDENTVSSIIPFAGGNSKFNVRYDASTQKFIALVNKNVDDRFGSQRNVLTLLVSDDLVNWEDKGTVLTDPTVMNSYVSATKHGFQYVDWIIDGDDILLAVREAMDDSNCYHNANYITFYRLKNYKQHLK